MNWKIFFVVILSGMGLFAGLCILYMPDSKPENPNVVPYVTSSERFWKGKPFKVFKPKEFKCYNYVYRGMGLKLTFVNGCRNSECDFSFMGDYYVNCGNDGLGSPVAEGMIKLLDGNELTSFCDLIEVRKLQKDSVTGSVVLKGEGMCPVFAFNSYDFDVQVGTNALQLIRIKRSLDSSLVIDTVISVSGFARVDYRYVTGAREYFYPPEVAESFAMLITGCRNSDCSFAVFEKAKIANYEKKVEKFSRFWVYLAGAKVNRPYKISPQCDFITFSPFWYQDTIKRAFRVPYYPPTTGFLHLQGEGQCDIELRNASKRRIVSLFSVKTADGYQAYLSSSLSPSKDASLLPHYPERNSVDKGIIERGVPSLVFEKKKAQ